MHNGFTPTLSRILELDALRGLAILSVVAFHYTSRYDTVYGHVSSPFFYITKAHGVNLFFIISGYVTFMTIQNKESNIDFLVSRFSRLYPCYLLGVILTFGVLSAYPLPGHAVTLYQALINLTMFPYLFGVERIDGVYWALYVIISFNFTILLIAFRGSLNRIRLICFICLCIQAMELTASNYLGVRIPGRAYLLLEHGHLFIVGIIFYKIKTTPKIIDFFLLAFCLAIQLLAGDLEDTLFLTLFIAIIYLIIRGLLSFIAVKPLIFLGTVSYALFLIHQNIGYVVIYNLSQYTHDPHISIVVASSVSILLASMMTYWFEQKVSRVIRTRYSALNMDKQLR